MCIYFFFQYREIHEKGSGYVVLAVCYTIYTIDISHSSAQLRRHLPNTFRKFPWIQNYLYYKITLPSPPPLNLLLLPYVSVIRVNNPKCIHTFQPKQTCHFWCMYALIQHSPEQTLCTLLLTTKRNSFITNVSPLFMKLIFLAGISKNLICIYALLCAQFLAKYFQSL